MTLPIVPNGGGGNLLCGEPPPSGHARPQFLRNRPLTLILHTVNPPLNILAGSPPMIMGYVWTDIYSVPI